MKFLKSKKLKRQVAVVFASSLLFTSVLHASSLTKKIDATFKNIKVFYNQTEQKMTDEPFIHDNRVFLPVRAISELVGQDVHWNSTNNTVSVSGSTSGPENRDLILENARLKAEIQVLKDNIDKKEERVDLAGTLKYLEEEFDYEYSIDWGFNLKESNSRIDVDVSFDSRTYGRRWEDLSKSDKERFFRDISREIRVDHKDAAISGKVIDTRTKNTVGSFSYSRSNAFTYTDEGVYSLYQLERDLNNKYRKISDTNILIDDIKLTGNEDDIVFTLTVNLSNRELIREWDDLVKDRTKVRDLLLDIQDDIRYDYRYASVEGYIEDYAYRNDVLVTFDNGSLTFKK